MTFGALYLFVGPPLLDAAVDFLLLGTFLTVASFFEVQFLTENVFMYFTLCCLHLCHLSVPELLLCGDGWRGFQVSAPSVPASQHGPEPPHTASGDGMASNVTSHGGPSPPPSIPEGRQCQAASFAPPELSSHRDTPALPEVVPITESAELFPELTARMNQQFGGVIPQGR